MRLFVYSGEIMVLILQQRSKSGFIRISKLNILLINRLTNNHSST